MNNQTQLTNLEICVEEIKSLQSKLKAQQELIDITKEALGFYADKYNWKTLIDEEYAHCLIVKSDVENKTDTCLCGGKRAREALAKMEEK